MNELPDDVTRFLDEHISSVMQLEVLLALRAEGSALSARQLVRTLGGSVDQVLRCILDLQRAGFVRQTDDVSDMCAIYVGKGASERAIAQVADAYAKRKVRVITFLLEDRSRSALDDFSDAFRLRRKD